MRSFVSLRLCAQLCFFGALVCLFRPFSLAPTVFLLLPVLALIAGYFASGRVRFLPRFFWSLLPALALPAASADWVVFAFAAAGALYAAVFLAIGRFCVEWWEYRREALILIFLSLITLFASLVIPLDSTPARILCAACIFFVLPALRSLRLGSGAPGRWQLGNLGLYAGSLAGGVLLGAGLWFAVPLLRYPIQLLLELVGRLYGWLLTIWNALGDGMMNGVTITEPAIPETTSAMETGFADSPSGAIQEPGFHVNLKLSDFPWKMILIVLAVIAVILVILRILQRNKTVPEHERRSGADLAEEALQQEKKEARTHRLRRRAAASSRDRLRAIYRNYLKFLRANGISPGSSATTAEISEDASSILIESDELLRGLYRRARYSREEITEADIRAASEALSHLQREENLRKSPKS